MRSTFSGLNTMVRGVFANQLSLDTVGHNITNASTEGYSRQKVNLAATRGQGVSSLYGNVMVGTGVDSMSIERARNIYADKQFWQETSTQEYYKTTQVNYEKIEAVFDDSDKTGLVNAMGDFYKAWQNLSKNASTASTRVAVIEKGNMLADRIKTAGEQLQSQINSQYEDMRVTVNKVNETTDKIVQLNKNIMQQEAAQTILVPMASTDLGEKPERAAFLSKHALGLSLVSRGELHFRECSSQKLVLCLL